MLPGVAALRRLVLRVDLRLRIDERAAPTQKTPRKRTAETDLIRHIVFFSARRRDDVEAIRAGLSALAAIPYASLFEVALNRKVDPLSDEVDVVVYAEFEDEAALAAYKAHAFIGRRRARSGRCANCVFRPT